MLKLASTKLRDAKTFNDANEVQNLTTEFGKKSAEMEKLYAQYKVMTICILLFVGINTNQQLGETWTTVINAQLDKATKEDTEHYEETKKRLEGPAPTKTV